MDWGDAKTIRTPEQVAVTYSLAGLGTRFAAVLVDTFVQSAVIALALVVFFALSESVFTALGTWLDTVVESSAPWVMALFILLFFGLVWGYFIFWETVWSGQTPGKRLCGIRVLRDGGFPIDFRAALVRNIMRYVDFLPFYYGLGAVSMFASKESKRLGDYAAGTIVVVSPKRAPRPQPAARGPEPQYRLLGDLSLLNLRAISREQFQVIDRFLVRRQELPTQVRLDLARQIATPFFALIGLQPQPDPYPFEAFLIELAAAYRHRVGG
jgi:uncharacterized RDD family membrane protein YckC